MNPPSLEQKTKKLFEAYDVANVGFVDGYFLKVFSTPTPTCVYTPDYDGRLFKKLLLRIYNENNAVMLDSYLLPQSHLAILQKISPSTIYAFVFFLSDTYPPTPTPTRSNTEYSPKKRGLL